ncbi:MAG: hypothetical protein ACK5XN_38505, partial [Bacteroidota bacterium]
GGRVNGGRGAGARGISARHHEHATAALVHPHAELDAGWGLPVGRALTGRIKPLIETCKAFKIGRTLAPDKRSGKYEKYKTMHVLCEAKQSMIEKLEAHYIQKYIEDPKNDNKKLGSAGPSGTSIDGKYYLYLVLR